MNLQFFAEKDIQQVNAAAKAVGVDRNSFGNYIHELKEDYTMKASDDFSYQELLEHAREFKKRYMNVTLDVYIRSDYGQLGFTLNPEVLQKMALFDIETNFHILSLGLVE